MRKHIGKALQTRSAAIKTALQRYNAAALALDPPCETLKAEDVVEYAFLSDFDLLRDTHQDIHERPWSTAMGRIAMDQHFNLLRAPEKIVRIVTHLRDKSAYLQYHEERLRPRDPMLTPNCYSPQHPWQVQCTTSSPTCPNRCAARVLWLAGAQD